MKAVLIERVLPSYYATVEIWVCDITRGEHRIRFNSGTRLNRPRRTIGLESILERTGSVKEFRTHQYNYTYVVSVKWELVQFTVLSKLLSLLTHLTLVLFFLPLQAPLTEITLNWERLHLLNLNWDFLSRSDLGYFIVFILFLFFSFCPLLKLFFTRWAYLPLPLVRINPLFQIFQTKKSNRIKE